MDGTTETFQITFAQAELYEATFVPAIFGEWAPHLVDAAGVSAGARVLDVACGTGVVARAAADRVGPAGAVTGVDLSKAMLAVARRTRPDLAWRQADAANLPFPDGSFDVVLCQSALMFFPDPVKALGEMGRVTTARGTVAVQVYSSLDAQSGYRPFIQAAARHAGPDAVNLLGTYWIHGDLDALRRLLDRAGLHVADVRTRTGTVRFDSVDELVGIEIGATPLADRINDEVYGRILADSREALARFRTASGGLAVPIEGHIVTAHRK
jgi:SAM-dependent methyltransferase